MPFAWRTHMRAEQLRAGTRFRPDFPADGIEDRRGSLGKRSEAGGLVVVYAEFRKLYGLETALVVRTVSRPSPFVLPSLACSSAMNYSSQE